ncbi:MAG: GNAT family N-acetyltransferase [Deltaproteobacteria bacterium]|nr:GNAT family N-acetyltransferase [Deltaproteobacteria bacterium]
MPVAHNVSADAVGLENLSICLALRRAVFVDEQGVDPALDADGLDDGATQFLAWANGVPIGTARLRIADGTAKAERVAVLDDFRGRGVGLALMNAVEASARAQGHRSVLVHAQQAVVPFYERLGYTATEDAFDEAGIPHRRMRKCL